MRPGRMWNRSCAREESNRAQPRFAWHTAGILNPLLSICVIVNNYHIDSRLHTILIAATYWDWPWFIFLAVDLAG